jgi:CBS domain-containing protein
MATVRDILAKKGTQVLSIQPEASVYDAARLMNEHKVGAVLVTEAGRLLGIFTERDVLMRIVAQRRDPVETRVEEVMTTGLACCRQHTTLDEARGVMMNRRIRHLPVVNDAEQVQGLVSIGDLNAYDHHSQEQTIHFLHQYIYGQA